jgi:choline dehydrogenase-like flavoprotein
MNFADFDVVVVGSGAGGGASAWRLATQGLKVLVLEAGKRFDPVRDYQLHTPRWEATDFPEKPGSQGKYIIAPMQALDPALSDLRSWNAVTGPTNQSKARQPVNGGYQHVRGVGGSTLRYTGEAHRMHPDSMKMKTRFGVAADWPVDYAALELYYAEAEKIIGVAGPVENGARWRSGPYPLPAHPLSKASRKLQQAAGKLGMQWIANSRAALSAPYDGRPACNYCGNCNRGCPLTDKGSTDVTYIPKALATGRCTVLTELVVTRVVATGNKVSHLECIGTTGKSLRIPVKRLVLSCGAIETPRLLLASANDKAPHGLANESGQVGKNFMETLSWLSTGMLSDPIESFKGLPADSISWDFNGPDAIPDVIGGCRFSSAVHEAGLNGPINYATRIVTGFGKAHKEKMRQTLGHAISVGSIGEFLPNKKTFIDLDPKAQDAHGIPLARIHSELGESEVQRLRFMAGMCRKILRAAGVTQLVEEYGTMDFFNSTHVFGTCRMGDNPADSVVNAFGQSHSLENLSICDASVFPSSGGGESPSLTIAALAIRNADAVVNKLNGKPNSK